MAFETDVRAAERLIAELAKPLPPDKESLGVEGMFDPWALFDGMQRVGAYSSDIDMVAIWSLEALSQRYGIGWFPREYQLAAEMFFHMLCGNHYCDYGVSPRGAFMTAESAPHLTAWIAKYREWYVVNWGKECPPWVASPA